MACRVWRRDLEEITLWHPRRRTLTPEDERHAQLFRQLAVQASSMLGLPTDLDGAAPATLCCPGRAVPLNTMRAGTACLGRELAVCSWCWACCVLPDRRPLRSAAGPLRIQAEASFRASQVAVTSVQHFARLSGVCDLRRSGAPREPLHLWWGL